MNISPAELAAQAQRALQSWPWIPGVEDAHGLPRWLLIAIASRETNCTNEPGDALPRRSDPPNWPGKPNHAWSPWQIDMNSGGSPDLLSDPRRAADIAGGMLRGHLCRFNGDVKGACSAYNAGEGGAAQGLAHGDSDRFTTGHDYGADVMGRLAWLQANVAPPAPPIPTRKPLMDRAGLITFLSLVLRADDATAAELAQFGDPSKTTDRQVVLYFGDSLDGTAIKLSHRIAAGLH